jgi:hypothetical protein
MGTGLEPYSVGDRASSHGLCHFKLALNFPAWAARLLKMAARAIYSTATLRNTRAERQGHP